MKKDLSKKYDAAMYLTGQGWTNLNICAKIKQDFGTGIANSKLAEFRAAKSGRVVKAKLNATKRFQEEKTALAHKMLVGGASGYAINQACVDQFGSGFGYDRVQELKSQLRGLLPENPQSAEAIIPIPIPAEMLLDPEKPEEEIEGAMAIVSRENSEPAPLVSAPAPKLEGSLTALKQVQAWMATIHAIEVTLTAEGKLSMLVRHEIDLGGSHE